MNKCKIIAEVSCNHMGYLSLAKKMIESAKANGANYVKFQTWKTDNLKPGPWDSDGRREIYEKAELSKDDHRELKKVCDDLGVFFLTSCFCEDDLEFIRSLTNEVKIPSPECTNDALVYKALDLFDAVFISTGATRLSECQQYASYDNAFLLHCVSAYPCPYDKANMLRMLTLKNITPRIGYSGHCVGIWDAITAIGLGAKIVEKHFTIDRCLEFRDNKFAILPDELLTISQYAESFLQSTIEHGCDYQGFEENVRQEYSGRWNATHQS